MTMSAQSQSALSLGVEQTDRVGRNCLQCFFTHLYNVTCCHDNTDD